MCRLLLDLKMDAPTKQGSQGYSKPGDAEQHCGSYPPPPTVSPLTVVRMFILKTSTRDVYCGIVRLNIKTKQCLLCCVNVHCQIGKTGGYREESI